MAANETPLVFSHEYATQGTASGTRVLVEVTAENDGDEPITTEEQVPNVTCTFLDDDGETLHETGRKVVQPVGVGESTALEFPLAIDTEDVTPQDRHDSALGTDGQPGGKHQQDVE